MHPLERRPVPEEVKNKKMSVLIPFLNEEKIIVKNTYQVIKDLEDMGLEFEIILIDDGSKDNSYGLLAGEFTGNIRVRIVRNMSNFGKGWALKTGYEYSTGDYVLFLDSDLELSPWHVPNFFNEMVKKNADAVIGSKLHPDSVIDYPLSRKIISLTYYFIIKFLFGLPIMDSQTGIKLFKREALELSLPKVLVKKFAFDIELLIILIKRKKKIVPAPIELRYSRKSFGNIGLETALKTLVDTLSIFFRNFFLNFYDRPMGENRKYSYTIVLFPEKYDQYEKKCLEHFLKIMYEDFRIVLIGKSDMGVKNPRLIFCRSTEEDFNLRLKTAYDKDLIRDDIIIFSTLECFPDERFLFSAGRILSLPDVGSTGGYVTPRPDHTMFEIFSFSVLSSFFLNLNLTYRYKPLNYKEVVELQLNGLFIKKECLSVEKLGGDPGTKLEYSLGSQVRSYGRKITYSPDIILYKKFPENPGELIDYIRVSSRKRAHQFRKNRTLGLTGIRDNFYILSIILLLFISAEIVIPVYFHNILFAVPLILYYFFMLFSRILFFGFIDGPKGFIYLVYLQILYGVSFLSSLFDKL